MSDLNRQQLCAELQVSDSTIRRLERAGLPVTMVGARPRYDLDEVKRWLRANPCQSGPTKTEFSTSALWSAGRAFTDACRQVQVRGMPNSSKPS